MKSLMLSILLLTLTFTVSSATAQESSIAVVDIKRILKNSSATKSIQEQIEKKRSTIQSQISKQEEQLREKDKELSQQRSVLSKEAFEKKLKEFKKEVADAQRNVQARRAQMEKAYAKALSEVEKVVLSIISEQANSKGFKVAVPKANTLYTSDGLDISEEVLKMLDDRLPKVNVKIEE